MTNTLHTKKTNLHKHTKPPYTHNIHPTHNTCTQVDVTLPPPPPGRKWCRVVDTNLPAPRDFTPGGNRGVDAKYGVQGFSSILLIAKPASEQ